MEKNSEGQIYFASSKNSSYLLNDPHIYVCVDENNEL